MDASGEEEEEEEEECPKAIKQMSSLQKYKVFKALKKGKNT